MLVVLDEGKAVAQSMDEIYVGTVHALAAMSQRGVSTSGLLQRYGLTPTVLSGVLADDVLARRITTSDLVSLAKAGELSPVFHRETLLRELLNLLGMARSRHVILLGPAGVGKRSLVQSLALLMAEGKGPAGLGKLVQVGESALLDDAAAAVQAGLRQAAGGILFLPNIHRFFGGVVRADFPKATRFVQKALLDGDVVLVGTAVENDFNERLAGDPAVAEHLHLVRVPEPDEKETAAILAVHKTQLEADYSIQIADDGLPAAARLARRYLTATPLPASAVQLLHRACALVRMDQQAHQAFRPSWQRRRAPGRRGCHPGPQPDDRHPGHQPGCRRAQPLRQHGRTPAPAHHRPGGGRAGRQPGRQDRPRRPEGRQPAHRLLPLPGAYRRR